MLQYFTSLHPSTRIEPQLTAFKSLSTSLKFLHPLLPGYLAGISHIYSLNPSLSNTPPLTILKLTISAPSSKMLTEVGGIEPGRMPPMSAWWPREAVKNIILVGSVGEKTGEMIVMSGRWLDRKE